MCVVSIVRGRVMMQPDSGRYLSRDEINLITSSFKPGLFETNEWRDERVVDKSQERICVAWNSRVRASEASFRNIQLKLSNHHVFYSEKHPSVFR